MKWRDKTGWKKRSGYWQLTGIRDFTGNNDFIWKSIHFVDMYIDKAYDENTDVLALQFALKCVQLRKT